VRRRDLLLAAAAVAVGGRAAGQEDVLWAALQAGGVVLLLRHAQTEPGLGDPPGFRVDDCSTQRNLSGEGRRQAERIGAALAARRIRIDRVLSSQWCRCLDTARLVFPGAKVEADPALNSFFDDRTRETGQTRAALAKIAAVRAPANAAFVTHHVNILALTGEAVGSGEAVLARAAGGAAKVLGRLAL
jgi:phosphohistidine phosphatase SixA